MEQQYSTSSIREQVDNGETPEFVFFWGHTAVPGGCVGKACMSQWYPSPFTLGDITYKTAEHWMMAQKALLFDDRKVWAQVIACEHANDVKALGRAIAGYKDEEWNRNKFNVVKQGNLHKFNQDPALAAYLVSLEGKVIVEASPSDTIWGIGLAQDHADAANVHAWRGQNLLGFALMEVRDFLIEFGTFEPLKDAMTPPWIEHSGVAPADDFWRKGKGEKYIRKLVQYFSTLDDRQRQVYMLTHPQPYEWLQFYEG